MIIHEVSQEEALVAPGALAAGCVMVTDWNGRKADQVRHAFDCPHTVRRKAVSNMATEMNEDIDGACVGHRCSYYEPMFLRTFAVGRVVGTREMNGYDDSDFYATRLDDDNCGFSEAMYATTRGWTYASGADVDASPAIMDLYHEYRNGLSLMEQERQAAVVKARLEADAKAMRVTTEEAGKLRGLGTDYYERLLPLLKVKKFRSEFRKSLATQVRDWLKGSTYVSPLSPRQWMHLA